MLGGFGFARVLVNDPRAVLPEGVEAASVDRLCREADVISLHAPLTDADAAPDRRRRASR